MISDMVVLEESIMVVGIIYCTFLVEISKVRHGIVYYICQSPIHYLSIVGHLIESYRTFS